MVKDRISAAVSVFFLAVTAHAQTYTSFSAPGAGTSGIQGTQAYGISGNDIVGLYYDSAYGYHGYLYNGSTYTAITYPGGGTTIPYGIDGNIIVGQYSASGVHGFIDDNGTYSSLDAPLAQTGTFARGVSGNLVVGYSRNNAYNFDGFLYDISGSSYTTIDDPLAGSQGTEALGIDGNNIVGTYWNSAGVANGFLYSITGNSYTTIDDPLGLTTYITGISGNDIVGYYQTSSSVYGFLYNGSTFTTLADPAATNILGNSTITYADGIDGTNVVGYSQNTNSVYNGFVAAIPDNIATPAPEPGILALAGLGGLGGFLLRKRFKA